MNVFRGTVACVIMTIYWIHLFNDSCYIQIKTPNKEAEITQVIPHIMFLTGELRHVINYWLEDYGHSSYLKGYRHDW